MRSSNLALSPLSIRGELRQRVQITIWGYAVDWPDWLLSLQWRSLIDAAVSLAFDCANMRDLNEQGRMKISALSEVQVARTRTRVDLHCCVVHGPDTVAIGKAV